MTIDPFKIDGSTCISFSGGRTSAYMLWRVLQANGGLPEEAVVCFANTGKEDEATLRFVQACGQRWGVHITWLEYQQEEPRFRVVDFDTADRHGRPFEAVIAQRGGYLPNRVSRYCSSELKTRTMHRYLKAQGWTEWDTFIGIRADEPRRVAKFRANPRPEGKHEEVWLPLAAVGVSSQDVAAFWRSQPFDLELPNIQGKTMHGNCDLCYLKPASQILSLIQEKPERAVWWIGREIEAEKVATTGARFRDDMPSYQEMARFASKQTDMFDPNEEAIPCFAGIDLGCACCARALRSHCGRTAGAGREKQSPRRPRRGLFPAFWVRVRVPCRGVGARARTYPQARRWAWKT